MESIKNKRSEEEFKKAREYMPGGVNSPVRSFKSIGRSPVFIDRGEGPFLFDVDGEKYIDYCMSWGAAILGHSYPDVIEEVKKTIEKGTSFGAPTPLETELAGIIIDSVPSVEKIRFVNSGTEAVMSALRTARGFTGKDIIIKFDGCYHGHSDSLLIKAGSGVAGEENASSAGVNNKFIEDTISLPFNDKGSVEKAFEENKGKVAAVIVEPVPANMGVIIPEEGFLEFLREITAENYALLIFDEVITGFRLGKGGAQQYFDVAPDLTTLGKIIGGGFPVGAYGGRKEIMSLVAPDGPVYQAGTLSGNPVAMAAGIATLKMLNEDFYSKLNKKAQVFIEKVKEVTAGYDVKVNNMGSMFTIFFSKDGIDDFSDVNKCNFNKFALFYREMLDKGVYFSPSQYEANFISLVHGDEELERTASDIKEVINNIR